MERQPDESSGAASCKLSTARGHEGGSAVGLLASSGLGRPIMCTEPNSLALASKFRYKEGLNRTVR